MGSDPVDSQEITQGDLFDEGEISESAKSGHANGGFAVETPSVEPEFLGEKLSPEDWQVPSSWTSESTRKFRRRLFVGIAIAGCLLVATIFGLWFLRGTKPSLTVAGNASAEPSPDTNNHAETTSPETEIEQADPVPADPVPAEPIELDETADPRIEAADPGPNTNVDTAIPEGLLPANVLEGLHSDISQTPAKKSNSVVPKQPAEPVTDPLTDLPPDLASFVDLLDLPGNAPDAPPVAQANVPPDDLLVDQAADAMLDPMLLATPPPEVNIANALKLRVAIQTDGYPLASFILFCSELTQVPIQIDWFTFDLAGISISQKVRDPKPGVKPIGELISSIASEVGAIIEQDETRLLLTLANTDAQERFASALATDDFGAEDESVKAIVERFGGNPIWNEREQLNLRALVTDCLRLARGMESKLPEPAIFHWTVRASAQGEEAIDKSIPDAFDEQWPLVEGGESGPQLDDAITLAGLLRRTAQLNHVACIVNWDDARLRRLTPGQLVLPYADQPAGQMLARALRR